MKKINKTKLATFLCATAIAGGAWAEDVTLEFWTWYPSEQLLSQIIEKFEEQNPGIEVNLNLYDSGAYQDRMPLGLASGDPMDVVAVQTSTMVDQVKGDLEPIAPVLADGAGMEIEAILNGAALTQARRLASDGELYIAPLGTLGSAVAYYNMDILNELGIEIPQTREELANMVAVIKEKKPDMLPISFTGANWWLDEITLNIAEQIEPGFYNSVRYEEGGAWNSASYKKAFETMVGLYDDGIFSKDTLDLDYGRAAEIFQQGQAAMYMQGSWEDGLLSAPFREENAINLDNLSGSPLPLMVEGGQAGAIRSFIEVGLAVPKNSEHKTEAAKFIEFMTAGDGVDVWIPSLFVVPAKTGYEIPEEIFSTPESKAGFEAIAKSLSSPTSDRNNVSDFAAATGDFIIDSILNGTSADDQVQTIQNEWESGRYSNAN